MPLPGEQGVATARSRSTRPPPIRSTRLVDSRPGHGRDHEVAVVPAPSEVGLRADHAAVGPPAPACDRSVRRESSQRTRSAAPRPRLGPGDTLPLDRVRRSRARRPYRRRSPEARRGRSAPRCASRVVPGDRRHDGHVAPGQSIEQGRLAGIRRPGEHDHKPSRSRSPLPVGERRRRSPQAPARLRRIIRLESLRHIALVGEVEARPPSRASAWSTSSRQPLHGAAERALELPQGLPPLRLRLRVDQVGQTLRPGSGPCGR